jgi:hypothetical protein
MASKRKKGRKLAFGILVLLAISALLALAGFSFPHQILCVESGVVHADVSVITRLTSNSTHARPTRTMRVPIGVAPPVGITSARNTRSCFTTGSLTPSARFRTEF